MSSEKAQKLKKKLTSCKNTPSQTKQGVVTRQRRLLFFCFLSLFNANEAVMTPSPFRMNQFLCYISDTRQYLSLLGWLAGHVMEN